MLNEFKKFILRGNVVDLAVGVIIGSAFNNVVQALVRDMITPIISAIGGTDRFADAHFTVAGAQFLYGDFLNVLISFLIIAAVIFFLVVQPINKLSELTARGKSPDPTVKKCPYCIGEVPTEATKCKYCGSSLPKSGKKD